MGIYVTHKPFFFLQFRNVSNYFQKWVQNIGRLPKLSSGSECMLNDNVKCERKIIPRRCSHPPTTRSGTTADIDHWATATNEKARTLGNHRRCPHHRRQQGHNCWFHHVPATGNDKVLAFHNAVLPSWVRSRESKSRSTSIDEQHHSHQVEVVSEARNIKL